MQHILTDFFSRREHMADSAFDHITSRLHLIITLNFTRQAEALFQAFFSV